MIVKTEAKKNVLLLGDSFTYGHGCSDRVFYWDPNIKKHVGNDKDLHAGPSEFCWGRLIEKHYPNTRSINLSGPGKDNISCLTDALLNYRDHYNDIKIDMIIFSMTFDDRQQIAGIYGFANPNFEEQTRGRPIDYFKDYNVMSSWSPLWSLESWSDNRNMPKEYIRALEYYTNYLYSPQWGAKLCHASLYGVLGWAQSIGAKLYWNAPGASFANHSPYIDPALKSLQVPHIIDHLGIYDRTNQAAQVYRCPDGHANDLGHSTYFEQVIKPIMENL